MPDDGPRVCVPLAVLEREPELRAEIEEEIKNNNWGY